MAVPFDKRIADKDDLIAISKFELVIGRDCSLGFMDQESAKGETKNPKNIHKIKPQSVSTDFP
jgi:hypothetical protein